MKNEIKSKSRREFIKQSSMTAALFPFIISRKLNSGLSNYLSDEDDLNKFRKSFNGQIILPGDAEYDVMRKTRITNPITDKKPAIIATCKNEQDVLRSVEYGRQHQLEIAVRSGNHSYLGWGSCDNGIVVDLSQIKSIEVNRDKKTVVVTTGVTAAEVLAATAPFGLAPVLGQCGSVGSGFLLGGGLGWLSGKYGTGCDNLISANIITADTEMLKADSTTNEDLFWGIRGGGGNFGIVTSFEYKLHSVNEILGGSFYYPVDKADVIFKFYTGFILSAPDDLQADCYITKDNCRVQFVYCGDLDKGEILLDDFRKFIKPEKDSVKRRLYSEIYNPEFMEESAVLPFKSAKGIYFDRLSDGVIALVLDCLTHTPKSCAVSFNFSHYVHGEVCRVPPNTTAFELRKPGGLNLSFRMTWEDPGNSLECLTWQNETYERLQYYGSGRIFANYMSTQGGSMAKAVFGTNFSRLVQLKNRYDSDNIFHLNQNIIPDFPLTSS